MHSRPLFTLAERVTQRPKDRPVADTLATSDLGHRNASGDDHLAIFGSLKVGALGLDASRCPLVFGGANRRDLEITITGKLNVIGP